MKRYIDFGRMSWPERTQESMLAARWEACLSGLAAETPCAGVIDSWPMDRLSDLAAEGWLQVAHAPSDLLYRKAARRAVMATLTDDLDFLSPEEHTLVERMLIDDGYVYLDDVPAFEAAYTLRMRLWCDIGIRGGRPAARLDAGLMKVLPARLMRAEHAQRRARVFVFDGMMHGLLYLTGFLDERMPQQRFMQEVLQMPDSAAARRLACNYLEASFDCCRVAGCSLLVHPALAEPESLVGALAAHGAFQLPTVTPGQLAGSMNELLPEESDLDAKLRLLLAGALRPEYRAEEAVAGLRLLVKQGAPMSALRHVLAEMLLVLPTAHMEGALWELSHRTPRWIAPFAPVAAAVGGQALAGSLGILH
ncbi:MAG: hypothetical protein LBM74_10285 [Oscillospiraceae bacterium]|jgi:hypothetical protein|nr:hypothetical protein [Oscillospiraceae bacterium]